MLWQGNAAGRTISPRRWPWAAGLSRAADSGWGTGSAGRLGQRLCRQWWQHSGSSNPCISRGRRTEPGAHRARIVTCPAAPAGTPTSGHSACPQPAPGLREWQSSWSGEKCLSSPFGSWRKGLFLHSGFCCSGFSAASRAAVAVPSGWRQRAPKKKKKQTETGRLGSNSGKWGVWDLVPVFVRSNCFFFFSFIMGGFFGNPGLSLDLGNALQNQTPQPLRAFRAGDHGSSADQENAQPKTKRRQMLGLA